MTQEFVRSPKTGLLVPAEVAQREEWEMSQQHLKIARIKVILEIIAWFVVIVIIAVFAGK
jgi:hypothetical protein